MVSDAREVWPSPRRRAPRATGAGGGVGGRWARGGGRPRRRWWAAAWLSSGCCDGLPWLCPGPPPYGAAPAAFGAGGTSSSLSHTPCWPGYGPSSGTGHRGGREQGHGAHPENRNRGSGTPPEDEPGRCPPREEARGGMLGVPVSPVPAPWPTPVLLSSLPASGIPRSCSPTSRTATASQGTCWSASPRVRSQAGRWPWPSHSLFGLARHVGLA